MLAIKNLRIEFHDMEEPSVVIGNISFEIGRGEIVGIVGESGSGKSILSLSIMGLLSHKNVTKSGEILWNGNNLLAYDEEELRKIRGKEIGMVFQEPMTSLNPLMKVGEQVEEVLRIHTKLGRYERRELAIDVIGSVGFDNPKKIYKSYPHQLSGGMRQRIVIAGAIIYNPQLLIADEATTALDVGTQSEIVKLLLEINNKRNMSIAFISHDLSLVRKLCGRVIVMNKGIIVESGNVEDVYNNPQNEYTKLLIAAIPKDYGKSRII